jgi:glycosyltransferase involved in cell wall biosynthesis
VPVPTIVVDGRPLQDTAAGVARYVRGIVPELAAAGDVVVVVDGRRALPVLDGVEVVAVTVPPLLPRLAWLELGVGRWLRGRDAVFLGTFYASPLRTDVPTVTVFHDIAWETDPDDFGIAKRTAWRWYGRRAARRAAAVVAVSSYTARQLREVYGLPPTQIVVAPNAIDPVFRPDAGGPLPVGVRRPYVVTLGGARRRRLPDAVAAWRHTRDRVDDLQLVVVGAEAPQSAAGIVHLGQVDDATLASLLAGAEAFVYATSHEGFGLPAAEAMACGTPVVCARVGALPEVLGGAAAWADDATGAALGSRLTRLLTDTDDAATLRAAGLQRATEMPTWAATAAVILDACRRAARG